jgi:hypothetical protein
MKARIIKRTRPNGKVSYVIQQKHWLMRVWVDASRNNSYDWVVDTFDSMKEAKENLWRFDGSENKEEVVWPTL